MVSPCSAVNRFPQCKPTPESATRCCALDLKGRPVRPSSPPSAVAGLTVVVRKNGRPLPISDVYYIKPMLLPHEGWPMAVGNCSRLRGSAPSRKNRTAVRPTLALAQVAGILVAAYRYTSPTSHRAGHAHVDELLAARMRTCHVCVWPGRATDMSCWCVGGGAGQRAGSIRSAATKGACSCSVLQSVDLRSGLTCYLEERFAGEAQHRGFPQASGSLFVRRTGRSCNSYAPVGSPPFSFSSLGRLRAAKAR